MMQTPMVTRPIDYAKAIAELVAKMTAERAAQVYDFARFLQTQPAELPFVDASDEDWLNDTEEQIQAEDALWNNTEARRRVQFAALEKVARAEIAANTTQPMFDEHGELITDEVTHHS